MRTNDRPAASAQLRPDAFPLTRPPDLDHIPPIFTGMRQNSTVRARRQQSSPRALLSPAALQSFLAARPLLAPSPEGGPALEERSAPRPRRPFGSAAP